MRTLVLAISLCFTLFLSAYNSCNPTPTAPNLAWGVLDKTTNVNAQHADGDTVKILPNDQYIVTLQVQDPESIKEMDVSGAGSFTCTTNPDSNGQSFTGPDPLPAAVPIQTTTIPNSGSTSGFVMSLPFVYSKLDCGSHQYGNMPHAEEFFVTSGTLQFQGTDISWQGTKHTATLKMTP